MKGTLIRLEDAVECGDREMRVQSRRVEKLMNKWPDRLGLTHWNIKLEMCATSSRDDGEITWRVSFQTATLWQYMDSIITAYVPAIAEMSDDQVEEAFVHELCHILVGEMSNCSTDKGDRDGASPHEERVVTQITTAILGAYELGAEDGVKGERLSQKQQAKKKVKKKPPKAKGTTSKEEPKRVRRPEGTTQASPKMQPVLQRGKGGGNVLCGHSHR